MPLGEGGGSQAGSLPDHSSGTSGRPDQRKMTTNQLSIARCHLHRIHPLAFDSGESEIILLLHKEYPKTLWTKLQNTYKEMDITALTRATLQGLKKDIWTQVVFNSLFAIFILMPTKLFWRVEKVSRRHCGKIRRKFQSRSGRVKSKPWGSFIFCLPNNIFPQWFHDMPNIRGWAFHFSKAQKDFKRSSIYRTKLIYYSCDSIFGITYSFSLF